MLLSTGPLRAQLRKAAPLGRLAFNDCRYIHTTLPLLKKSDGNNSRAPRYLTEKDLMSRLSEKAKKSKVATINTEVPETLEASSEPVEKVEEDVEGDANEDVDLMDAAIDGSLTGAAQRRVTKQMEERVLGQALEKEKKSLVKKVQRRGKWDDNQARAAIDEVNVSSIENQTITVDGKKVKSARNNIEIAALRNQKYQVGDQQLSIEDSDVNILKKGKEKEIEEALSDYTLRPRKEEEIVADNDPELISVLLDRPSKVDKTVARAKGEELLEFSNENELAEAEKSQGKASEPQTNRELLARDRVRGNTRGPAMRKNKDGAEELTLVYDDQPAANRFTLHFKDPIKKLKYFPIYPKKIKNWVHYMKDCKGRFNKWGYWKNDPLLQEEEDKVRDAVKAKSREQGDTGLLAMVDKRKRQILPLDLEGHYRFGVQPDELIGVHPKIKEMLSFKHANNNEIHTFRTKQMIKRWQERPEDHGTPQVQVACMTNRINYLSDHVKTHKKDHQCKLQLRLLISKRQSMMKYLRKKNVPIYYQLVRELGIPDSSF